MTGQDFHARGVLIAYEGGGRWSVSGPADEPELMAQLRAEVERRAVAFRAGGFPTLGGPWPTGPVGACCSCGEPRPPYRGGHCQLCHLAIQKIHVPRKLVTVLALG